MRFRLRLLEQHEVEVFQRRHIALISAGDVVAVYRVGAAVQDRLFFGADPFRTDQLLKQRQDELAFLDQRVTVVAIANFSQAILVSRSSLLASSSSSRALVDFVRIPCWMAFSRFSMALSTSRSCCS